MGEGHFFTSCVPIKKRQKAMVYSSSLKTKIPRHNALKTFSVTSLYNTAH